MAVNAHDRRVRRTRKSLHDALMELMLEKGYEAVTVQDLIDRADVGRSTFYAHFRDKDELLSSAVDQLRQSLVDRAPTVPDGQSPVSANVLAFSLPMLKHAQANHRLYQALVVKGGAAMVERLALPMLNRLVVDEIEAFAPTDAPLSVQFDVVVVYVVNTFMALLKWWLEHGMPCSAEDMDRVFRNLVRPGLEAVGLYGHVRGGLLANAIGVSCAPAGSGPGAPLNDERKPTPDRQPES